MRPSTRWTAGAALALAAGTLFGLTPQATPPSPPAASAPEGQPTLRRALDTALDDERRARAFYAAVMRAHGERRPFANIIRAESRHEAALLAQHERLGLTAPADRWADHAFEVPASFAEACDASVVAEVRNADLYDELIAAVDDEQVIAVFRNLQAASRERHLPAFRRRGSGWGVLAPDALTPAQADQHRRALGARDAMFGTLMGALTDALRAGGPDAAIAVCAEQAPAIAQRVAADHAVRLGRTSWKLRNPGNAAPVWAELPLDERPESPVTLADRSGRLGVLTPIRVSGACLQCHGGPGDLAPGVPETLARLYPDDHATGFADGDLRGWFWIEVPAAED